MIYKTELGHKLSRTSAVNNEYFLNSGWNAMSGDDFNIHESITRTVDGGGPDPKANTVTQSNDKIRTISGPPPCTAPHPSSSGTFSQDNFHQRSPV